jgi:hypothetical protein
MPSYLFLNCLTDNVMVFRIVGVESKLGPLGTSATEWPIVPAPVDYDDGEFGGMKIGRGNRSTRRKPAPAPLCPPQIPLDQTRVWTLAAAVGSQRLTSWAMARPCVLVFLLPCSEFRPRSAIFRLNIFSPRSPNVSYITSETDTTEAIIFSKIENDH